MAWIQNIDFQTLFFIQEHMRYAFLDAFWKGVTFLGNGGWFWIALGVIFLIFSKSRAIGFRALLALAIGFLITNLLLKNLVARVRPYDTYSVLIPLIARQTDYSFPSGHACASFASAIVYLKMLPARYGIPLVVLASMIAFSRLYVGVHYPTDVLGGVIVGVFSGWLICRLTGVKSGRLKTD